MTAELANAGEGAMYARIWHGMGQHDYINLECSVRHLADHVVELCGLPAGTLVDLCTERGRLLELPTRFVDTQPSQVLVERADDVLRRGYVYLPVLVAAEAPSPPPLPTSGSHPNHHHHGGVSESRPSSSRSPLGSRHGTAGAGKGRRAGAGGAPDASGQPTAPVTAAGAADSAGGVPGAGLQSGSGASGTTGQQEDGPSAVAHNAALLAAEAAHTALNTTVTTVATAADDVKIYYHVLLNPSVLSQHLPSFELQVRGAKVSAKTSKSSSLRRGNSRK
jgi:hypothetical protein